jgi:hypothetical protein
MELLEFFIVINLPAGRLGLKQKYFLEKGGGGEDNGRCLPGPNVFKSGSLNLLELSGPVQACAVIGQENRTFVG